jgi:hypothetical protein
MNEPAASTQLPRSVQFQLELIGPLLLGMVCGFFLGISAAAYWAVSAAGLLGGIAGGLEQQSPAPVRNGDGGPGAAARGFVAGCLFGAGVLIAHAASGEPALAPLPPFEPLLVPISGAIGGGLAHLGARLAARVSA